MIDKNIRRRKTNESADIVDDTLSAILGISIALLFFKACIIVYDMWCKVCS